MYGEKKKLLFKYTGEMVYIESEKADFYYKCEFYDGMQLIVMLQKMATNLQSKLYEEESKGSSLFFCLKLKIFFPKRPFLCPFVATN